MARELWAHYIFYDNTIHVLGTLFYPRWAHFRNATAERVSLSQVQYNIMMAQC